MNTQKKTQDEKARKRLMEVARSGKSLMPRMGGGGPLMPKIFGQEQAPSGLVENSGPLVGTPEDDLRSRVESFDAEQNWRKGHVLTGMQKERIAEEGSGLLAEGKAMMAPSAAAVTAPSAVAEETPAAPSWQDKWNTKQDSSINQAKNLALYQQQNSAKNTGGLGASPSAGLELMAANKKGTLLGMAGGGRISGWTAGQGRAAQINAAVDQVVGAQRATTTMPAEGTGGVVLTEAEQRMLEANRAKEAQEQEAQKPLWKRALGMAGGGLMPPVWDGRRGGEVPPGPEGVDTVPAITQAGPVMLDSQIGPGRQEYVLTPEMVEALGGAGELDVLRQALGQGGMGCGEDAMACGGKRKVPKMAGGGPREAPMYDPDILKAEQQRARSAAYSAANGGGVSYMNPEELARSYAQQMGREPASMPSSGEVGQERAKTFVPDELFAPVPEAMHPAPMKPIPFFRDPVATYWKSQNPVAPTTTSGPPPTAEQLRSGDRELRDRGLAAPVLEGELMPAAEANGDLVEKKMYGNTAVYKNNLMPNAQKEYGKAIFSDTAKGATREGLDQAIREKGQTIPYNASSPAMLGSQAEADLRLLRTWGSLKPQERGRMPDSVAKVLNVPYARPETKDQAWAAMQRQQAIAQAQAQAERQAKVQEEIVKGEYGVEAARAKAQDEAGKYKITEEQNQFDPEGPPLIKVERQGRGEPPALIPAAATAPKMPAAGEMPKIVQNKLAYIQTIVNPEVRKQAIARFVKEHPEYAKTVGAAQ